MSKTTVSDILSTMERVNALDKRGRTAILKALLAQGLHATLDPRLLAVPTVEPKTYPKGGEAREQ
jgi:hypothetical protein